MPRIFHRRGQHDDLLGVDVRAGKAHRLDVDLVELPIAAALRPFVAKHGPHGPQPARRVVSEVVLDDRPHHTGGELRTQRQVLTVERSSKRVHLLFDDVGDLADALHEELGVLDNRRADLLIAVAAQPVGSARLEPLPERRIRRQQVVHAADPGKLAGSHRDQAVSVARVYLRRT